MLIMNHGSVQYEEDAVRHVFHLVFLCVVKLSITVQRLSLSYSFYGLLY